MEKLFNGPTNETHHTSKNSRHLKGPTNTKEALTKKTSTQNIFFSEIINAVLIIDTWILAPQSGAHRIGGMRDFHPIEPVSQVSISALTRLLAQ